MFNKSTTKVVGKAEIDVLNPKNGSKYVVEFLVVREDFTPLIGLKTLQTMELIEVRAENIDYVNDLDVNESKETGFYKNEARGNKAGEKSRAAKADQKVHKQALPERSTNKEAEKKDFSTNDLHAQYRDIFTGVGKLPGKLHIQTDESVRPIQLPARSVPEAMKQDIKDELDRLVKDGIISTVSEPTDWVSAMVAVSKPTKGIRICIDPQPLNTAIKRNHYPLPTIEDLTPALANAKVFTVCDAKSGYWHVELDTASSYLTTFATPWGRYRWRRMPFGLCLASEEFQRRLHQALEGLEGVMAIADDILVYGNGASHSEAVEDHDRKLLCLLERCRNVGLKLNMEKMKLRQTEVNYMGHIFTPHGMKADPDKIKAVKNMPAPEDRKGVQRVLGLVNYLQRFAPNLAEASAPLRSLLKKENTFIYEEVHKRSLENIKEIITQDPVLKYYDVKREVVVQVDASSHGLGACLMQDGQPVAYASRALNETEKNYAQIEKELLAIVYGLNKFERFTQGKKTKVESDHKPLESIMKKPLVSAPKRLQRMMLQLQKYDFEVVYKRGQEMYIADALSRAHEADATDNKLKGHVCLIEEISSDEVEIRNMNALEHSPVSDRTTKLILQATEEDQEMQEMIRMIKNGWPGSKKQLSDQLRPYYNVKEELSTRDGLVLRGEQIVIPKSIRHILKERVHSAHIGLQGCLRRAREAIYWPGMTEELKELVTRCSVCLEYGRKQQRETLRSQDIPQRPWQYIACDMMEFKNHSYLVTVDTFSDFIECDRLSDKRGSEVIRMLKSQMARHGLAEKVMTDNGPPFNSAEFRQFAEKFDFRHQTSSPGYPQSNGKAESAVKILKNLMIKAEADGRDAYLALLDWRNTPTESIGSSPAQRLFGRRTRTLLPTTKSLLKPKTVRDVPSRLADRQQKQAVYYNRGAKDLPMLSEGEHVYMAPAPGRNQWRAATVSKYLGNRSYLVKTDADGGVYRRNRRHLRRDPGQNKPPYQEAGSRPTFEKARPAPDRPGRGAATRQSSDDEYMYIPVPSVPRQVAITPQQAQHREQAQVTRSPYLLRSRRRVN